MTTLGVFRDDFYNAVGVLPLGQYTTTALASGTLPAANMAGGQETFVSSSGATALTTDTAANIIARLQNAVAAQYAAAGYLPPGPGAGAAGVPNILNLNYTLQVNNTNGGTLTLTAGSGVTITGTATLSTGTSRVYLVTITGPNSVTMQNLGGFTTL